MLLELRAENYAVIDRAAALLGPGLNLMTGETGAGKSILIDALVLLLGGKASADFVRHGAERAVVSCVFEATPGALEVLAENGIDPDEDGGGILLRREVSASGKGRVFVNSQPATVGVLRALAPELALVHAQSETMGAFDQVQQRLLLDRFAGVSLDAVKAAYAAWRGVRARLEALLADEQDRLQKADMWRFQVREIEQAGLGAADEDVVLEAEKRVLANAEKLYTAAMGVHELLYEAEHAAATTLGQALKLVEELARYDASFRVSADELAAAQATVADLGQTVREYADHVQAGPERLAEIEERLVVLDRLKRKYGGRGAGEQALAAVIAFAGHAAQSLAEVEDRDQLVAGLRAEETTCAAAYREAARELSRLRSEAAKALGQAGQRQINELAMQARFEVGVQPAEQEQGWAAHGWDEIAYRIATNPGEPMKGLAEIASGGEMSRVMLALKVTVEEAVAARGGRKKSALPRTLVFDEIDLGIGGRAAEAVGRKLKALSRTQQVVCITHLPQIAAFADQHFLIAKQEAGGRTHTELERLEEQARVREIARMLSGATLTETSLRHAENLLDASRAPMEAGKPS